MKDQRKTIRRLPPCSAVDLERMESWLTDMAAQGWHLRGTAAFRTFEFERGEPQIVRYRLESSTGEPDDPATVFFEELGWKPIMRFGHFYIFRALSEDAPELSTDPAVQLFSMKRMRLKTVIGSLLALISVALLLILRFQKTYRFLAVFGFVGATLMLLMILALAAEVIVETVQSGTIVKKMKDGIPLDHAKPWKKGAWWHRVVAVAALVVYGVYLMSILAQCAVGFGQLGRSVEEFQGDPPFVTIEDLCPEGTYTPENFNSYNTFAEYASDCVPRSMEWQQYGKIVAPDGEAYEGALIVRYHKTAASWLARGLAEEYLREALKEDHHQQIQAPELDVDYAAAYSLIGMPTIILQKGDVVITASIGVRDGNRYMLEEWCDLMLQMLNP